MFDRSGLAALSDLRAPGYDVLFAQLEGVQREFLETAPQFRDPRYAWDTDTLHNWSRAWEYAYILHHLSTVTLSLSKRHDNAAPTGIDFGSGSTFFPFAVARLGVNLVCFDNDPVVVGDLQTATQKLSTGSGTIEVRHSSEKLPAEDASADFGYSVSVLEHMPNPVPIVAEIARVLKPGAHFVLTMDLDVEGSSGVSPQHYDGLRKQLESAFDWVYPDRVNHPLDVLTSKNSPWPRPGENKVPGLLFRDKTGRLRPLIGGPNPGVLTVYGCVLRRK